MTAPDEMSIPALDGFWARVLKPAEPGGCWQWTGVLNHNGYGRFTYVRADRRPLAARAHRIAYELAGRVIPEGMQLDHLCRNRACVNPEHLEPVTAGENTRRATKFTGGSIERRELASGISWRVVWRDMDATTGKRRKFYYNCATEAEAAQFVADRYATARAS